MDGTVAVDRSGMFDDALAPDMDDDDEVMIGTDELVDKKEETFDAGKSIPFCPDVVIVLLTAPGKVVGTLHSGGDGPPLTVELLLSPFDRDEEEALSAG